MSPKKPDVDAYSIRQFCRRHDLWIGFFYKLQAQGLAPAVMRVGARVLVSAEAASRWRAEREHKAETTTEVAS